MKLLLFIFILVVGTFSACTSGASQSSNAAAMGVHDQSGTSPLIGVADSTSFYGSIKKITPAGDTLVKMTVSGTLHREDFELVNGFMQLKGDPSRGVSSASESPVWLSGHTAVIAASLLGVLLLLGGFLAYTIRSERKTFAALERQSRERTQMMLGLKSP